MPARVCFNESIIEFGIQQEAFSKSLGVSDGRHGLGAKVSIISLVQQIKCGGQKLRYNYTKSVLLTT